MIFFYSFGSFWFSNESSSKEWKTLKPLLILKISLYILSSSFLYITPHLKPICFICLSSALSLSYNWLPNSIFPPCKMWASSFNNYASSSRNCFLCFNCSLLLHIFCKSSAISSSNCRSLCFERRRLRSTSSKNTWYSSLFRIMYTLNSKPSIVHDLGSKVHALYFLFFPIAPGIIWLGDDRAFRWVESGIPWSAQYPFYLCGSLNTELSYYLIGILSMKNKLILADGFRSYKWHYYW